MDNLEEENKDLRFEIDQQLGIIESQKQELHSAQMKVDCLSRMKVEMEIEIEALHGLQHINGDLEAKVKSLETELNSTRLKSEMLEEELRTAKENHEKTVSVLNIEIKTLRNKPDDDKYVEEKNILLAKLGLLEGKNTTILKQNFNLQNESKIIADRALVLEISLHEKTQELEQMKHLFDLKSNDLKSTLKLVEELQEEKACISSELLTLKTRPAPDDKRGNSLFAEVDDKRRSVTQTLESYKKKYAELKKSLFKKNSELRALEGDLIDLKKKFKESENAPFESMAGLNESYKTRIHDLEYRLSILEKRPENPQIIPLSEITSSNYESIKTLVDNERKSNRELAQEMERRSLRELALGEENFKLKNKVRILTAKTIQDSAKVDELKFKLEAKTYNG